MAPTDKRMKEVEDSVRAIAEYVKQQNSQLEKNLSEKISKINRESDGESLMGKNLADDLAELRKKLDSISSERHISPIKLKSIDDFEERLNSRIDKLEERVANIRTTDNGKIEQKVGGTVSTVRKEFDDFRHDIVPRMHFLEGKLNKVKDEVDEIASSSNFDDVREKLESVDRKLGQALGLKNQIDEVEKAAREVKDLDKRLVKLEQEDPSRLKTEIAQLAREVDTRFRSTEERLVAREAETFKKVYDEMSGQFKTEAETMRQALTNFEHARSSLESRMKSLDTRLTNKEMEIAKKMQDEVSRQLKTESQIIKKQMEEFNKAREEFEEQIRSIEKRALQKEESGIKKIHEELSSRLKEESSEVAKRFKEESATMKKEMMEFSKAKSDADERLKKEIAEFSKAKSDVEERLKKVETRVNQKETDDFKKLYDRVSSQLKDEAAAMKAEMMEFKNARQDLEEKLSKMNTVLTQRQSEDFKKIYDEIEERVARLNKEVERFDHNYASSVTRLHNEVDKRVRSLEIAEKDEIKRLIDSVERRMKIAEEHKASLQKFTEDSTKKMREDLERRMRNVEEHKLGFDNDAINRLEQEITNMKQLLDKEAVNRMAAEKRFSEIADTASLGSDGKMSEEIRHKINQIEEQLARISIHDDKKIEEYVKQHVHTPQYAKVEEELENTRRALENEIAVRLSLEKRLHENELALRETKSKLDGIGHIDELSSLGNRLHDMEKNVKLTSVKLLTQQLNDFAKSMDRKLPNIVAREEYMREVADINRRLKTIESPDLAPLGSRVERLERKLDDITHLIRGLHNRVPVVVE